jgi:hypothetical protein
MWCEMSMGEGRDVEGEPTEALLASGGAGTKIGLTAQQIRTSKLHAMAKTLSDAGLFFSAILFIYAQWTLQPNTQIFDEIAAGENKGLNALKCINAFVGTGFITWATFRSTARYIRQIKMNGPKECDESIGIKVCLGVASFYKGAIKTSSIGLTVFTIQNAIFKVAQSDLQFPNLYIAPFCAMLAFVTGIFPAEFANFASERKPGSQAPMTCTKKGFMYYVAFSSAVGGVLTYLIPINTSLRDNGWLDKPLTDYFPGNILAVMALVISSVLTVSMGVSTGRFIAYKVGSSVFNGSDVKAWTSKNPHRVHSEIKISSGWKAFSSAVITGALIYTLSSLLQKAVKPELQVFIAPQILNVLAILGLTTLTYDAQYSGLVPKYLRTQLSL